MLVLEKQKDIHVLNAMGATQWDIQKIFLLLSGVMALMGALIGGGLASLFIWLQYKFHFIKLGGGSFIIDYYPIEPMAMDYVAIITLVIIIALLAGWIPSRKASPPSRQAWDPATSSASKNTPIACAKSSGV